ncbi:sporulenol synthase [Bacillus sp. SORGH_AS 510]|uniref:squalene--hopene cyclase n=1 Tax=Bacillus sp. SORGH_AS_0510 TaxID=3041771 RepID=UPI00278858DC|nr:squalene--hopene cyclase [Bacillus sp. SORGH_AS_0510]MDQ1145598.1 sporulenol synthase [Bacillus sp. SORGH_AS_0510]
MTDIRKGMDWLIDRLRQDQSPDGSWNYPFETGISTDAYTIILLRTLALNDEELIQGLVKRILSKQEKSGAWKLFYDEGDGNLTATLEAYYALLYSGLLTKEDNRLIAAKKYILSKGGLEEVNMFTKVMLAITGQYKWPSFSPLPIEVILLPFHFPINFYSFSIFGRANLAPIMILADKKFTLKTPFSPDLSHLHLKRNQSNHWSPTTEYRSLFSFIEEGVKSLLGLPEQLHQLAIERAKKYMIDRIEPDGTFYSYYSSTFLMIFALLALGYKKNDPIIIKAVSGLKAMKCEINGMPHMQYTTANVWNTSLISYSLQSAGIDTNDTMVLKANQYLLERQHHKFGDWVIHNPRTMPGGWGFSDVNTINPDVDDTTASLRAVSRMAQGELSAWDRGVNWCLSMQNDDGGWPAFERNIDSKLLQFLPIEKGEFLIADPSSADLTGRTLEFFGAYTNLSKEQTTIKQGVHWLLRNQEKNGSWYGRWGICYIYGSWAAITGLRSAGISSSHSSIQKAVAWLHDIQNKDGGWGESCLSDSKKTYVPLDISTLTHTSWALDALIAASKKTTPEIQNGITYLLKSLEKEDWTTAYPKGQGMAGGFYMHYHSYRFIFPLLALSHYQKKFES